MAGENSRHGARARSAVMPHQRPSILPASYGNVRAAVQAARSGISRELEGNVGMSVTEAARFARTLVQNGDQPVLIWLDGQVLHIDPVAATE